MLRKVAKFVDKNGEVLKKYDTFIYQEGTYIIVSQRGYSVTVEGLKPKETWGKRIFDDVTLRTMCVKTEQERRPKGERPWMD
ncbi:hypothetical protein [Liquorilactobacillus uvarum]|uniref:hypothetical protein n=1 Tax=Liquorilactobacillus uvarum TaxID=303240 RepID=UPI00288B83AB|nr:hypothetical protein [Liquorilactobacillus uvarum]